MMKKRLLKINNNNKITQSNNNNNKINPQTHRVMISKEAANQMRSLMMHQRKIFE